MVANYAVVCYMTVGHYKAIVTHPGSPAVPAAAVDRHKFANSSVITYLNGCFFPFIFEVLRNGSDHCSGKNAAIPANTGSLHDRYITTYPGTFANFHIMVNNREGINLNISCQLG